MKKILSIIVFCICLISVSYADRTRLYTSDKISSSLTTCIAQDKHGYIWIGTEHGLNRYDGYKFIQYFYEENDETSISDNEISSLFCDREGRLWIGTYKGLCRYDYKSNTFVRYKIKNISPHITCMCQPISGNILVGTRGWGLYIIPKDKDKLIKGEFVKKYPHDDFYTILFEDREHNIWRASHLNKVTKLTMKGIKPVKMQNFDLPCGEAIQFLVTENSGFLLVCSHGIMKYDYTSGKLSTTDYDCSILPEGCSIQSAALSDNGEIGIGTSSSGLYHIPRNSKKLESISDEDPNTEQNYINFLFDDKDNNLWISYRNEGIILRDMSKTMFHSWKNSDTWKPDFPQPIHAQNESLKQIRKKFCDSNINTATQDASGILYISDYGKGLIIYNPKSNTKKHFSMFQTNRIGGYLINDWINTMYIDNHKMLWIGTSNGISCMDTRDHVFNKYGWNAIMKDKTCTSIGEDKQRNIIIGTNKGLYKYDRVQNKVHPFPGADALKKLIICGIVCDNDGDLWISTSCGIWQWSQKLNDFISHVNGNGLVSKEYITNACYKLPDNRIGFGINNGFTVFNPSEVKSAIFDLGKVFLSNITIDGKSIGCNQELYEIKDKEKEFSLEFSLFNFHNTDDITFQYKIDQSDSWTTIPEGTNLISFNQMEPGNYTIEVRALFNGVSSNENCIVKIKVCSPWYLTSWSFILYFLLGITSIWIGFRIYEQKRERDIEEQKMQFLINATHDIRSPLSLILGPLKKLKTRITDSESQAEIKTIDHNAQRLLSLVNQILDERRIDKHQMHLKCTETDIIPFIKRICNLYSFNAQERNITFKFEPSIKHIHVWIDHTNFDKVINNLISNAFKCTFDGGEIIIKAFTRTIETKHKQEEFVMQIIDNGIGLKEEKTEKIFERFYQGSNVSEYHIEGTGIGLNLSRSIVKMHGGDISAINRTDGIRGSIFSVCLPLGNNHLKPEEIEKSSYDNDDTSQLVSKNRANRHFRILIADDDVEIADYIANELSTWYHFTIVRNGREALQQLLAGQFDLIISDIMMPQMDGIELLKNIKSNINISDIPIILLTSKTGIEHRLEGLKKGADGYLEKPFDMEELHILIDNLVDNIRRLKGKFSGIQKGEGKVTQIDVKGNNDVLMERIIDCINKNLTNFDFNVEQLSKEVTISRAHLHRKMKEITGISTADFIRNLRLEQAARLLKEGKINVSQVAYSVGFNNQTHFSTLFKKHFGMTPTAYAEKMK